MQTKKTYTHLESQPGSLYRQPFIKGTRIRAEIPFGLTIAKEDEEGPDPALSPSEIARSLNLPEDAVLEAINWCQANWDVVVADHAREQRLLDASGVNHPDYKLAPDQHYRLLPTDERARIINEDFGTLASSATSFALSAASPARK
jgi:uncharacterized protein (DUF433 family)